MTFARLALSLALLAGCGGGEGLLLPGDGEPAAIEVLDGSGQLGRVGDRLADPLVVEVTDSRGRVVQGARVAFEFGSSAPGAAAVPNEAITNSDGIANAQLVLGTTIGQQTGQARVVQGEGRAPIQAPFSAMALPENANSLAPVAGQDQIGHVGQPLDDRLVVEVTDGFGNPVAGVPISWAAEGGGSVSEAVVATDEDGRSRVDRILGPTVGQQTTLASADGLAGSPVTFVHTALSGDASRLVIISGADQTAEAGTTLPADLVVQLLDAEGNGVPETAVSWVVAIGGGAASPAISTTDADGRASTRWTLGAALGQQRLDAVVSGVGFASFLATATAGAPASLFIRTQPSATARNGVRLDRQPVIQLRDAQGNDVAASGVQVTAQLDGGGELEGTIRRTTDASGRATFDDLAISGAAGTRTLTFTAAGYAQVTSSEIDLQAIGTTTTITGDSPDPSVTGSAVTVQVRVTSEGPTPTGSVTVGVSDGTATCTATLSAGVGSCQLTLGLVGNRTLTATYSGAPGLAGSSDTEPHTVTPSEPSNEAPDADYNWDCQALTCHFTDASEDDDGDVVSWNWNFGGTGSSSQQNPTHTFPGAGRYEVTLTVSDNDGASDASVADVEVEAPPPENQPPTAEFTWQCDDLECDFEDESNDPDGDVEDYDWTFGDGGTSDDDDPRHDYSAGGTYPVTLTVTDDDGARNSVTHQVSVVAAPANQPPTAEFTWQCNDLECDFEDESNDPDGDVEDYDWTFGDGGTSDDDDPQHEYSAGGTYSVTLTVTDDDGARTSVTHDVTVAAPPPPNQDPTASFTESCADLACSFSSAGSTDPDGTIVSYNWDFGDGSTSDQPNPSHTYSAGGSYNVTLQVRDDDNATDEVTRQVTVTAPPPPNEPPTAAFDPPSCTVGQPCQFTEESTDDGTIVSRVWDFGDGTGTSSDPSHTYLTTGDFQVTLTVTDDDAASNSVTHTVTVSDPPAPGSLGFRTDP